jgi:hypothetical protein
MPTIADIYRSILSHEELEKSAAVKKTAIANPVGGAGASVGEAIENVLGPNIAETKVRIKKKLEEVAGQAKAVEGLSANREDEHPASTQTPRAGDQMPPGGSVKASAEDVKSADGDEEKVAAEKVAAEKVAAEYYAAGQIMARGFADELATLMGPEQK